MFGVKIRRFEDRESIQASKNGAFIRSVTVTQKTDPTILLALNGVWLLYIGLYRLPRMWKTGATEIEF